MKAVKAQYKILKNRQTLLIQLQLYIFYEPACLQKNFHGRLLSIRALYLGLAKSIYYLSYFWHMTYRQLKTPPDGSPKSRIKDAGL